MIASVRQPQRDRAAPPVYRCVACDSRWQYEQVRLIARCRSCGCGLAICGEPAVAPAPTRS